MLYDTDIESLPTLHSAPPPAYDDDDEDISYDYPPPAYFPHSRNDRNNITLPNSPGYHTRWLNNANSLPSTTSNSSGSGRGSDSGRGRTLYLASTPAHGSAAGRSLCGYVVLMVGFTIVVGATIGGALADARSRTGAGESYGG
ncbi:hypothetical protein B0A55_06136 [Friedmanniomyces simplex]|uniref:Uncharacterized protein n=1 Tax=Friedmanniomyces simplex TaxID=329884 RepID=A0A4U0XNU1_9PEZI|nr:hypothetical protein B0A55_06136 [Friedmanniomyces simplex]